MALYHDIAKMLKERILRGDYALTSFPPVQTLAQELGISYVTAHRAVKLLQDDGLVVRRANWRLDIASREESDEQLLQIALLVPTFASPLMEYWRAAIEQMAAQTHAFVPRPVLYTHWHDPLLTQTLDAFDGVFLFPYPAELPEDTRERICAKRTVIVIDADFTHLGLPSIQPYPPVFVQRLLDHLEAQGHRHIDCLNVQPKDRNGQERIDQWALWMAAHQYPGRAIVDSVKPGTVPHEHAYEVMDALLTRGEFSATALLGITLSAAIGAARAFYEHGIRVGEDVAVCAMNGESIASCYVPSITAIEASDPTPYISRCLNWLLHPDQQWVGSLLMEPKTPSLVVRESTNFRIGATRPV